jgi:hypothetical protein
MTWVWVLVVWLVVGGAVAVWFSTALREAERLEGDAPERSGPQDDRPGAR